MHLYDQIEEYVFTHGKHFEAVSGQYELLMPHDLGRPLTHAEMDYNFLYQKQTMNGFRIFGSGTNKRLNDTDLDKVLQFHKIQPGDADYAVYTAAGYVTNQYIWIPATLVAVPVPSYTGISSNAASVNEGASITWTITSTNVIPGTTVNYVLSGTATSGQDYPAQSGLLTINSDSQTFTIPTISDHETEAAEFVLLTLDATDSAGTACGLNLSVGINDTSLTPLYNSITSANSVSEGSAIVFTVNTSNFWQSATIPWEIDFANSTATASDFTGSTSGSVSMSSAGTGTFTVNVLSDLISGEAENFTVKLVGSDSNSISGQNRSKQVTITDVSFPTYTTFVANSGSYNEGQTATYTLSGTSIPNGTQVGYTISGGAGFNVADISLGSLSGFITMSSGTGTLSFNIEEDNSFEGAETLEVTLNTQDSAGNATGLPMGVTVTILDVAPTYSITGNSTIAEGTTNTYTITTHNVAPATTLYWELRNGSTNQVDFATDITSPRTGQFTVNTVPSSDTIDIVVATDSAVEPNEEIVIYVWDDAADVSTLSPTFDDVANGFLAEMDVTITDVVFPSYTSFSSITTLANDDETNEGEVVSWKIVTDNVISGTIIGYTITGVDVADIDVALTGTITITGNNTYYNTNIALDNLPEGAETMTMTLDATDSASTTCGLAHAVTILDTSQTPTPTFSLIANSSTVNEGGNIVWTLTTANVADNTTVPFTLSGPATIVDDYSEVNPKEFTITTDSGTYTVTTFADNTTEGNETVSLTLGATDSAGNATGGLVSSVNIIDTSQDPIQYQFIATPTDNMPNSFMAVAQYYGEHSGTFNGTMVDAGQNSFDHVFVYPADGYIYSNQNQVLLNPGTLTIPLGGDGFPGALVDGLGGTAPDGSRKQGVRFLMMKGNIQSTWNANISATDANGGPDRMYQSLTGPSTWAEGQGSNGLVILNTAGISDAATLNYPNGVTCGYTITGSATGGGVDYGSGGLVNPVVLTADAVGIDFSTIVADLITEGSETVTITLDDFDSLGNPTFGLTKTITITDDSQAPAESMYWMHLGETPFPYQKDLMGVGPFAYEATGGSTNETDFAPIFEDMVNNPGDWTVSPGSWGTQSTLTSGDTFNFPAGTGSNFYYFLIPDSYGTGDLTTIQSLSAGGGPNDTAAEKKTGMLINGVTYTMYRVNALDSTNTLSVQYN